MLLRLAYLGVTNAFAPRRLLPLIDRDKDVEILALRHQIVLLERQLGNTVRGPPPATGLRSCALRARADELLEPRYDRLPFDRQRLSV